MEVLIALQTVFIIWLGWWTVGQRWGMIVVPVILAALVARYAHANGVPWWVDGDQHGDAYDMAMVAYLGLCWAKGKKVS